MPRPQGQECGSRPPRLSGSGFHLDVNCLLTFCSAAPVHSPPLPRAFSALAPQPGARGCLLSHSHSPGCKRTKSPCTPLASCCPSLCATPQPCLGLPERREAQASMDLPPPPFPGPSRGPASALTGQSGASTVGAKGTPLSASHSVLACLA